MVPSVAYSSHIPVSNTIGWLAGWLAGCWLKLFKAELSLNRYWWGPRPQVVGKEGDYA